MICQIVKDLNIDAPENGTIEVKVFFRDQEGDPVVPASLFYTLVDAEEKIINNLDAIALPLESDLSIFLTGDDLSLSPLEHSTGWAYRWLILTGTYNQGSSSGLKISASCRFKVCAVKYGGTNRELFTIVQ